MFEGKAELFIRRWEPSFIPKLRKVAALEKGVVSSLLDQEGEQNDVKQSSFFPTLCLYFLCTCICVGGGYGG